MTVHMFRVLAGPQSSWPQVDINAAVEDWMSKQSEWEADPTVHSMLPASTDDPDGPSWWMGDYRLTFESEPKDTLFSKLEDKLVNKVHFYRIGHHQCDHDLSDREGCTWDEVREWTAKDVTIPPELPVLETTTT